MATGVTKTGQGELVVPAGSSSLAVPKAPTSTVLVASGVSLALVPGPVASELVVGAGPLADTFDTPTLDVWRITGANINQLLSRMTVHADTTTGGAACTLQFKLEYDRFSTVFTVSDPEQNNPHAATGDVVNTEMFGQLCDLSWRWWSGVESEPFALVAEAAVLVPGFGDPPTDNEGTM